MEHNRKTIAKDGLMRGPDRVGETYILTSDGRLFGPFPSRSNAVYWCLSQGISVFSTYDLLAPINLDQHPRRE